MKKRKVRIPHLVPSSVGAVTPSPPEPSSPGSAVVEMEPSVPGIDSDEDLRELIEMYEEKNGGIQTALKEAKDLAKARDEIISRRPKISPHVVVRSNKNMEAPFLATAAVEYLIDSDVMDYVEGLRKIFTIIRRARTAEDRNPGKLKVVPKP